MISSNMYSCYSHSEKRVNIQRYYFWGENGRILTYWFDLGSVQFPPVEHDGMDGVTCPSGLDGSWEHIQEILEEEKGERKVNRTDAREIMIKTYIDCY